MLIIILHFIILICKIIFRFRFYWSLILLIKS